MLFARALIALSGEALDDEWVDQTTAIVARGVMA
jgi:hypothetical protein